MIEKLLLWNFKNIMSCGPVVASSIERKSLFVCVIPYFGQNYYLINNHGERDLKIYFEDGTHILTNTRYVVSKQPVKLIKVLEKDITNLLVVGSDKPKSEKYVNVSFSLKDFSQYFKEKQLVPRHQVVDFLFKIEIPETIKKYITNKTPSGQVILIQNMPSFVTQMANSKVYDGYIFTNNSFAINRMLSELETKVKNEGALGDFSRLLTDIKNELTPRQIQNCANDLVPLLEEFLQKIKKVKNAN